jgi:hypothetical protein
LDADLLWQSALIVCAYLPVGIGCMAVHVCPEGCVAWVCKPGLCTGCERDAVP